MHRWQRIALAAGATVVAAGAVSFGALATVMARRLVTRSDARDDDLEVLAIMPPTPSGEPGSITLPARADTVLDGVYGLVVTRRDALVLLGRVLERDALRVTREALAIEPLQPGAPRGIDEVKPSVAARVRVPQTVGANACPAPVAAVEDATGDAGATVTDAATTPATPRVEPGDLAHTVGWIVEDPTSSGVDADEVGVPVEHGTAPAWRVLARTPEGEGSSDWLIAVHGRGANRREPLRAARSIRDAGWSQLIVSLRNDGDGPDTEGSRYGLGLTESRDVVAAMRYAVTELGARRIVLMGYSMGGAAVLQVARHPRLGDELDGLVLDSPVVRWRDTLRFLAHELRLPRATANLAQVIVSTRGLSRGAGLVQPLDLAKLDSVRFADELRAPTLLLHSRDDGFVIDTASRALAERRPDIVRFEHWSDAVHCRLWNLDPERYESTLTAFLRDIARRVPRTKRA